MKLEERPRMQLEISSYVDLFIQISILIALILDYFFVRKKSLKKHGVLMVSAFLINIILVASVMILPFLVESTEILENVFGLESLLFLSHHVLGLIAVLLGGFLVLKWTVKAFNTSSCKGKTLMRATFVIWIISILLGIVIFVLHFIE